MSIYLYSGYLTSRMTANWQATLQYDWIENNFDVIRVDLLTRYSVEAERENTMPRYSFKLKWKMKVRQNIALTEN